MLSAGEGPLTPPHWVGEGSRIVYCSPQTPTECSELSLQGLCKAHPGLPGLQGESCEGGLIQVKGHKGVGTS